VSAQPLSGRARVREGMGAAPAAARGATMHRTRLLEPRRADGGAAGCSQAIGGWQLDASRAAARKARSPDGLRIQGTLLTPYL
jgi:hypothetical protein